MSFVLHLQLTFDLDNDIYGFMCVYVCAQSLFATPWTAACQAPLYT